MYQVLNFSLFFNTFSLFGHFLKFFTIFSQFILKTTMWESSNKLCFNGAKQVSWFFPRCHVFTPGGVWNFSDFSTISPTYFTSFFFKNFSFVLSKFVCHFQLRNWFFCGKMIMNLERDDKSSLTQKRLPNFSHSFLR